MDTVYITGHKNPDTDSIVSAMAYAALKNALGHREYHAARLGGVSDETKLVLDKFGFHQPELLRDVRTQVRDLDFDTPPGLSPAASISRAWNIIHKESIPILPVVNDDGTLYGMLSAGDVANYDMVSVRQAEVENIPVNNLLAVLEGNILNPDGSDWYDIISGHITIALPTSRENLVFGCQNSIVVCGNQPDMIRRALELQVNCLIVCQAEVDPELLALARQTCVISTPYDAYQSARLIVYACPIGTICNHGELVAFHLKDYLDDVQNALLESRFRAYPVLDDEDKVVGTLSRYHLLRPRRKRVVLVDHNEKSQSVPGLEQADILEIIDHHRLADIETTRPISMRNEPVGSTTTIVAGMYQERGLMPMASMAGLMASAILSDTVMFKSPTCTQRDIDVAHRMARIAKISLDELGQAIFSASCGEDKTIEAMLGADYKEFRIAGHDLAVSQITCMDSDRLMKRKDEFIAAMAAIREEKDLETVVLMITDVLLEGTQLLFTGNEDSLRQAFNIPANQSSAFLPKIMSRKKQVIPTLSALWG